MAANQQLQVQIKQALEDDIHQLVQLQESINYHAQKLVDHVGHGSASVLRPFLQQQWNQHHDNSSSTTTTTPPLVELKLQLRDQVQTTPQALVSPPRPNGNLDDSSSANTTSTNKNVLSTAASAQQTNLRRHSAKPIHVLEQDKRNGTIHCPHPVCTRQGLGLVVSTEGCNKITCPRHKKPTFHFCFHCKVEIPSGHLSPCACRRRIDAQAQEEMEQRWNEANNKEEDSVSESDSDSTSDSNKRSMAPGDPEFSVGTKVRKYFKQPGSFFDGYITDIYDDKYYIRYSDGDSEHYLFSETDRLREITVDEDPPKKKRRPTNGPPRATDPPPPRQYDKLRVGTKVCFYFRAHTNGDGYAKEGWYQGEICGVLLEYEDKRGVWHDPWYDIQFDDGDNSNMTARQALKAVENYALHRHEAISGPIVSGGRSLK